MKPLWPAWKAALVWGIAVFVLFAVGAAVFADGYRGDAFEQGQQFGQKYALIVVLTPVIAYIVQKTRIDSDRRRKP